MSFVPLGELVEIKGGGTPDKAVVDYWNGDIPWASVKDFKSTSLDRTKDFITPAGVKNSATNIIPAGTIIVPTRMAVGKAAISTIDLAINQDLKALFPKNAVDNRYLLHALLASSNHLERHATGATVKGITLDVLRGLKVRLPPLPEQQRIARIMDQADELCRLRRQALSRIAEVGQAIFYEMFGNVKTNDRQWNEGVTLQECAEVVSGITKGRKLNGQSTRSVPYMTVATVQDGYLNLGNVKSIEATDREIDRYRLIPSDILLTEGGDPDKLGRGTMWSGQLPECIHQNHVFRVRVHDKRITPTFASWLIGSSRGKSYFLRAAKQTTGIASINSTQLKMFPLLLPPIELQNEFIERLKLFEMKRKSFDDSMEQSDSLFASLQYRAFRGEL